MPHPALIALAPPLMVAHLPQPPIESVPMAQYAQAEATLDASAGKSLTAIEWSLAAVAAQQAAPPQEEPQEDSGAGESGAGESSDADENQIVVTGEYGPSEADPVEAINAESYRITQQLDEVFVEPVAYAYRDGLPDPLRDGLGNVVKNLGEPNNALNFLLQGKVGKSVETLGRLLINSTLGIGGLIDIAEKPGIGLPHRRNGFANTMGFYGVGAGPYLYLPVTGATSARDVIGSGLDQFLLPVAVGEPFNRLEFSVPFYVISNLDARLEVDEELKRIDDTIDPYAARRDSYLYRRAREIALLRGEEPPPPPAILEEVDGTGEFADPPASTQGAGSGDTLDDISAKWPGLDRSRVAITRPR